VKAAFHSQKLVLADLKVSEDLLTDFMKEVLGLAKGAEKEILDWTCKLQKFGFMSEPTQLISALDLAGLEIPCGSVLDVRARLESLASMATETIGELETRQTEFLRWQRRRLQPPATPITPTSVSRQPMYSPTKTSGRDVVNQMKTELQEEILSPCKENALAFERLDPNRLQEVVDSLECKMDGLLEDLELANAALEDKDRLFFDMEQLTARNESERISLENKLMVLESELQTLHERQNGEVSGRGQSDASCLSSNHQLTEATARNKTAGARLLCNVLERRSKLSKAAAFRKWSCNVSAMKATSNQKHDAAALAQQLDITREKLIVLKSHLNKGRRSEVGEERRKPRLRRLLDRLEKRDKLEFLEEAEDERIDL
jgi:hypothetical protein